MSVILRDTECVPPPRYVCTQPMAFCGPEPRPRLPRRGPCIPPCCKPCCQHNFTSERPCVYDCPCPADCFTAPPCKKPSGRYARTVWYPGECPPVVRPCRAFDNPNPPYPVITRYTVNKHV